MRKLFSFNMVSLDGFFEGPNQDLNWHHVDEEFNEFAIEQLKSIDTLIFGRITYLIMASYWPTPLAIADDPVVAGFMNQLLKIVFSKTLARADWQSSRLLRENAEAEITKLKQQPGKDIAIFGSANLISTLMEVIDEHRVMVNPVLLHGGTPLFQPKGSPVELKLVQARTFHSGNVLLSYEPVRSQK